MYSISLFIIILTYFLLKKICKKTEQFNKYFLIIIGCFTIILSGMRSVNVGTDVLTYKKIFEQFGETSLFEDVQSNISGFWGYRLLCKIVYIISGGNYQIMLLVSAIIIIYGFFKFIYYYSDNCAASVFYFISLYYLFSTWNIVRQSIAIAFFFLSVCTFDKKHYKRFVLYAILSISVHNIVALLYIYYLIRLINWNKIRFIVYSLSLTVVLFSVRYIIDIFCRIFPRYSMYLSTLSGNDIVSFSGESRGRGIVISITFLLFIIIALILFKDNMFVSIKDNKKGSIVKNNSIWIFMCLVMIEVIIGILFSKNTFYLRVQSLFSIFSIILLPAIIERFNIKFRGMTYVLSITAFLFTAIIKLQSNNCGVNPYEFFFSV